MNRGLLHFQRRLWILWERRWMIVGVTIGAAVLALCIALFFLPKRYTASTQIYFSAYSENKNKSRTQIQLEKSRGIAESYIVYMNESYLIKRAAENQPGTLTRRYSAQEIADALSIFRVSDSDVIQFDVTLSVPEDAKLLSEYFSEFAIKEIIAMTRVGNYYLFSNATVPTSPSFPIPWSFALSGGILGLVLSALFAMEFRYVVFAEKEIKRIVGDPKEPGQIPPKVLGHIPPWDARRKKI